MKTPKFEHLGYYKEFYQGITPLGYIYCDKDRDTMGWQGRRKETTQEDIPLHNKKTIKAGTDVLTVLYPLCGRMIKD